MKNNEEGEIKYYTKQELKNIFDELDKREIEAETEFAYRTAIRNKALFLIMYYCALRVTEVVDLVVSDYDFINNSLYCNRVQNSISNTLKIVDKEVIKALENHITINNPKSYLFTNLNTNNKMSRITIDGILKGNTAKNIKGLGYICKIDESKWNANTFRNTRAMHLVGLGLNIVELQYWLGHSNIENTLKYFLAYSNISLDLKELYNKIENDPYLKA